MAGNLVPLVLIPRFTTYAGPHEFKTVGMDVTQFQNAIVSVWRGELGGSGTPDVDFYLEESSDQETWTQCSGITQPFTPAVGLEVQYVVELRKRWFRIQVDLSGTGPIVTCWAAGFLEERLS
jgi:hypothetical protein